MKTPVYLLSTLSIIFVLCTPLVATQSATANGCITHSASADGSQAHPFLIENAHNLNCLFINSADYWSGNTVTNTPYYFRQTTDIDLAAYGPYSNGIGDVNVPFYGTYDGGGFDITGLSLSGNAPLKGMFGNVASGSVITDTHLVGAAILVPGIDNFNSAGLLAGASEGSITNSSASGTITITSTDSASAIGGLVGGSVNGNISQSSADVVISIIGNSDVFDVGGLVGNVDGTTMTEVQSTGTISTSGTHNGVADIGGIVGLFLNGSLSNAWSSTSIDSQGANIARYFGEIAGNAALVSISNVYSVGAISISTANGGGTYGAIIGRVTDDTTVSNSFWNSETLGSQVSAVGATTHGILTMSNTQGLATTQLRQFTTYATTQYLSVPWSILNGSFQTPTTIWGICNNSGYPFLTVLSPSDLCPASEPHEPTLANTGKASNPLFVESVLVLVIGVFLLIFRKRIHRSIK